MICPVPVRCSPAPKGRNARLHLRPCVSVKSLKKNQPVYIDSFRQHIETKNREDKMGRRVSLPIFVQEIAIITPQG